MIDRDPVQFGSEIPLDIGHQFAREGAEIAELGGIFRRNDEAEMMPVILTAFGERAFIRRIRCASNIRASAPSRVTPSRFR